MSAVVRLTVEAGPWQGRVFEYAEPDRFLLGRTADCHCLVAGDTKVSRRHLLLEIDPPHVLLQDLGSSNGTYVGDEKLGGRDPKAPKIPAKPPPPRVVKHGDLIRAGGTALRVEIEHRLACADCGAARAAGALEAPILVNGLWLCGPCSRRGASPRRPRDSSAPRCAQCAAPLAAAAWAPGGEQICDGCRRKLSEGDRGAVKSLLSHAVGGLRELAAAAGAVSEGPQDVDDYEIERKLGDGRLGPVFLARLKRNGERVAFKVMAPSGSVDAAKHARFEREIAVTMELRHPNIVRFLARGRTNCVYYFVLEYMPDGDLQALLRERGGTLPAREAIPIVRQAAEGLAFAHRKGYLHRDVRPNDLLLDRSTGAWTSKVGDFGLAKSFERSGLSSGSLSLAAIGKSAYGFAPRERLAEQSKMTPASDVFSLGAVLYHALTGSYAYDFAEGEDGLQAVMDGRVVAVAKKHPELPRDLAAALERCLSADPSRRFPDAGGLAEALRRLA